MNLAPEPRASHSEPVTRSLRVHTLIRPLLLPHSWAQRDSAPSASSNLSAPSASSILSGANLHALKTHSTPFPSPPPW